MRTIAGLMLACGAVLAAAPAAVAGEHEDALAVVEQAIKAHGGADALAKAQNVLRTGAGTITLGKDTKAFTAEVAWSLPDRLRMALLVEKKFPLTTVLNGDKGWQSSGGPAMEMGAESLRELRDELAVRRLATLTPLTRDEFKLAPLPEIKVNGEPAVGVKAARGKTEMKLYFDKKTHLLVKIERRASEGGQMLDKEYVFSDHKEFDGVKLPTKEVVLINGRKFTEESGMTYKLPKKIDDTLFGKP
jgi:outer membrane lipoprotein-sorting protein